MDKLTEIREALEAATPGPWKVHEWSDGEGYAVFQHTISAKTAITGWGRVLQSKENAHLIAHAPEYITYLLQIVETLQAQNEQLSNEMDGMMITLEDLSPEAAMHFWEYLLHEKDELVKALEWYAEEERYKVHVWGLNPNDYYPAEIDNDRGQRAREALKLIQQV